MKMTLIHGQNHKGSSYHIGRLLAEKFAGSDIQEFLFELRQEKEIPCMTMDDLK